MRLYLTSIYWRPGTILDYFQDLWKWMYQSPSIYTHNTCYYCCTWVSSIREYCSVAYNTSMLDPIVLKPRWLQGKTPSRYLCIYLYELPTYSHVPTYLYELWLLCKTESLISFPSLVPCGYELGSQSHSHVICECWEQLGQSRYLDLVLCHMLVSISHAKKTLGEKANLS